jgi:hydrogenase maturation protease HycI
VVLTFGNELLGDDAAGILFGRKLGGCPYTVVVEGGLVPENAVGAVIRESPSHIILADASDFGGEPGEYRLIDPDRVDDGAVSTHATTALLVRYLRGATGAELYFLGFQPFRMDFGTAVSTVVARGVERAARQLCTQGIGGLASFQS